VRRGPDRQQRDAPGEHAREHPVRRDAHPYRSGQEHPERQRTTRHVLGAERSQSDGHRDRRGGPGQHHEQPGRTAPAEPEPVQPHERQQRPRRVRADVRGPEAGLVGEDVVGKRSQHRADVGHAWDFVQVFLAAGEPLDHPALPAVHQRERHGPSDGRRVPDGEQPAPRQPVRQRRALRRDQHRDGHCHRCPRAHVRQPLGQQGRERQEDVDADRQQCLPDQGRRHHDQGRPDHGGEIGRRPGDPRLGPGGDRHGRTLLAERASDPYGSRTARPGIDRSEVWEYALARALRRISDRSRTAATDAASWRTPPLPRAGPPPR
jgi:hypothetical protein